MNFKITKCRHVTATEKKHLAKFLESGMTQAKINTKVYTVLAGDLKQLKIRISAPCKNDVGYKVYDHQTIEIEVIK